MRLLPPLVLCILLTFTFGASWRLTTVLRARNRSHFNDAVNQVDDRISDEFDNFIAIVRTAAGMFATKPNISRDEFATGVGRLRLSKFYPNVQGLGFAPKILAAERAAFEQRIRAGGQTNFTIHPIGQTNVLFPILYLEPQDRRNQVAIGYDMFSEPVRRAAMLQAMTNGSAASGRVTLVQETEQKKQPGFLIYATVFADGALPDNLTHGAQEVRGFVYGRIQRRGLFQRHRS